ncbi:MAG TPA: thioredoxin family protein [Gammaproteobacteria bacterium]
MTRSVAHKLTARCAAWLLAALLGCAGALLHGPANAATDAPGSAAPGAVELHFFWSESCPHCRAARPFVRQLAAELPWLVVHDHRLDGDPEAVRRYVALAAALGQQARSVPAFLFCERMWVGYDDAATTGAALHAALQACRAARTAAAPPSSASVPAPAVPDALPGLGGRDPATLSLPLLTLLLAGLDAFNPCAFFVLLFLLSLMVHARSRARMLLVGGVFVLCSGLVYFAFMAAWLNLFLLVGGQAPVTAAAGAVALGIGMLNAKDYFHPGAGPSLAIPDTARPGLYRRVRALVGSERLPALLAGSVLLALAANSYELLCTAGFPMVYTRVLTLHALPPLGHYAWLALYNVIYVLPLLAIVLLFGATLGARRLTADQGRLLKLLSGLMMLGLGALLLLAPNLLANPWTGAALVAAALLLTWLARRRLRSAG